MARNIRLYNRLTQFFRDKLYLEVPSPDTDLIEAGLLDSLNFAQLMVYVEQEFAMHISPEDLEFDHFRSIANIAAFVATKSPAT